MSAPISQAGPPQFFATQQSLPAGLGDDEQELDNILDDIMNIESQWDGAPRKYRSGVEYGAPRAESSRVGQYALIFIRARRF